MAAAEPQRYRAFSQFAARAALLLALVLPGCSDLALPKGEMPAAGVEPTVTTLVANHFKGIFKDHASFQAVEISGFRWVHTVKGWSWLACVRFQDHGHPRTYSVFIGDGAVVDYRYAVETDECDIQTYSPFDLATGAIIPASIGAQQPIY